MFVDTGINTSNNCCMIEQCIPAAGCGVIELPLLLTPMQAKSLEDLAYARSQTMGRLIRDLLQEYLDARKTEQVTDS
ncbi:MAG: hypothetical protein DWH82_02600 [Planctomycetota bacterium]|nr:MAG: hypothetical protein DWH82_02600 [Planctomycetota bacterium]